MAQRRRDAAAAASAAASSRPDAGQTVHMADYRNVGATDSIRYGVSALDVVIGHSLDFVVASSRSMAHGR